MHQAIQQAMQHLTSNHRSAVPLPIMEHHDADYVALSQYLDISTEAYIGTLGINGACTQARPIQH